jgi:uroporphyrinogen-III synthase
MILEHYNHLHSPSDRENNAGNDGDHSQRGQGNQKPALLFMVGEQRCDVIPRMLMSDSLPEHQRIQVDELVVYETGAVDSFEGDFRAAVERHKGIALDGQTESEGQDQGKIEGQGQDCMMWVVVFSPTGCDAMLRVLLEQSPSTADSPGVEGGRTGNPRRRSRRLCSVATIGPTTRDHLRSKYGFDPEVCAARPSPEGVGKGIEAFMQARQMEQGDRNR